MKKVEKYFGFLLMGMSAIIFSVVFDSVQESFAANRFTLVEYDVTPWTETPWSALYAALYLASIVIAAYVAGSAIERGPVTSNKVAILGGMAIFSTVYWWSQPFVETALYGTEALTVRGIMAQWYRFGAPTVFALIPASFLMFMAEVLRRRRFDPYMPVFESVLTKPSFLARIRARMASFHRRSVNNMTA